MTSKREDREALITEAAEAILEAMGGIVPDELESMHADAAKAALAVFEQAHTPTDDERETLYREAVSRAEDRYPALNDDDEVLSYPRAALRQHKRGAYLDGFTDGALRRPVQGEPEWEYGNEQLMHSHVEVFPASSEAVAKAQAWLYPMRRRRKAGPWEAVPAAENDEREEQS